MESAASVNTIQYVEMTFPELHFNWGEISGVTAQPESHGSQLRNTERSKQKTQRDRIHWHFTAPQTDTCRDKHALHSDFYLFDSPPAGLPFLCHGPRRLAQAASRCPTHTSSAWWMVLPRSLVVYLIGTLFACLSLASKSHTIIGAPYTFSCKDIRFSMFYFTHGRPPQSRQQHKWCCSFPNFAYEIRTIYGEQCTRLPHLPRSCPHYWRDTIESPECINLDLKWLSPAGQILTSFMFSLKRALYHQEKGRKDVWWK